MCHGSDEEKVIPLAIPLDKSTEEADSTKTATAEMEKEYETLKDSTKAEEENVGSNEEPKGK